MTSTQPNIGLGYGDSFDFSDAWIRRKGLPVLLLLLFISVAGCLAIPFAGIGTYYERLYNEGFNLYHANRLARGEGLFELNPWATNNYPFLSFYLTVLIGKVVGGDLLFVGRWLSAIGLLGAAVSLYLACRSLRCSLSEALLGTGIAVGLVFTVQVAPWVASDDPQFLGQCLAMAGLAIYLRDPDSLGTILASAALVVLAGFTKHNLIAVPLAVGLDLLFRSRRNFAIWLIAIVLSFGILLAVQRLVAGPNFVAAVLQGPRVIEMSGLNHKIRWVWETMHLPLAIATVVAVVGRPVPRIYLLFVGAATAEILLFSAGDGVSFNILLELVFAAGMGCALAVLHLRKVGATFRVQVAVALLATVPIHFSALEPVRRLPNLSSDINAVSSEFQDDMAWLAARPGKAICESMLLCLEAGHELVMDPFNARQMIVTRRLDESGLIRQINARQIAVIQLRAPIILNDKGEIITPTFLKFERFTKNFLYATAANYRIARESSGRVFYVPQEAGSSGRQ